MYYVMTRTLNGKQHFWKEDADSWDRGHLGVLGCMVDTLQEATKIPENMKSLEPPCRAGFSWEVYPSRYKDALLIQSAVNPAGISRTLHEAFREVIAEGGDTNAQQKDPACRLILHQLAYLLRMGGGYDLVDYRSFVEFCEAKVATQKGKDSK